MEITAAAEDEAFEVWSVNWKSLLTFLETETQWRVAAGFAGLIWLGLDYASVRPLMEDADGRVDQVLFADLRAMERAALPILNAPRGND